MFFEEVENLRTHLAPLLKAVRGKNHSQVVSIMQTLHEIVTVFKSQSPNAPIEPSNKQFFDHDLHAILESIDEISLLTSHYIADSTKTLSRSDLRKLVGILAMLAHDSEEILQLKAGSEFHDFLLQIVTAANHADTAGVYVGVHTALADYLKEAERDLNDLEQIALLVKIIDQLYSLYLGLKKTRDGARYGIAKNQYESETYLPIIRDVRKALYKLGASTYEVACGKKVTDRGMLSQYDKNDSSWITHSSPRNTIVCIKQVGLHGKYKRKSSLIISKGP